MDKLKATQTWAIGESVVWAIFVIVNTINGLVLMHIVKASDLQEATLGRIALAFALLAFFYLTFKANKIVK